MKNKNNYNFFHFLKDICKNKRIEDCEIFDALFFYFNC